MTADHWTHHDPAVRALIRAAQAEALRDAAAEIERLERIGTTRADEVGDSDSRWYAHHPLRTVDGYQRHRVTVAAWLRERAALAPAPTEGANGRQTGSDERVEAYDGAAADRRSLHDPDSGRIDNWSER